MIGEGVSCRVHEARWNGRDVVLKLYKAAAVERHLRLVGVDPAEFEYRRNREFHEAPGLARYTAEPLACMADGTVSALLQEKLDGELYYDHLVACGDRGRDALFEHVERIVELSHRAGLYDLDLHAANLILVAADDGELVPKLFDFNFIPFYVHPPNPLVWLLVKTGLVDRRWRDVRKLRRFHDVRRIERALGRRGDVGRAAGMTAGS